MSTRKIQRLCDTRGKKLVETSQNKYYNHVAFIVNGHGRVVASAVNGLSYCNHAELLVMKQWLFKAKEEWKEEGLHHCCSAIQERRRD